MLYAQSTGGFYDPAINTAIPADAVTITDALYQSLLAGEAAGQVITADGSGNPVLAAPPAPTPAQAGMTAYLAAINAGVQIISASAPALNGIYGIQDSDLLRVNAEQTSIVTQALFTNKAAARGWKDAAGTVHMIPSIAVGTAMFEAIAGYVDALETALATAQAGGAWVAPAQPAEII